MIRKLFFYIAIAILVSCTVAKKERVITELTLVCNTKTAVPNSVLDSILSKKCNIMMHLEKGFVLKKETPVKENATQFEFRNSTDVIFIKTRYKIDDTTAINLLRDKQFLIDNLFKVQPSPYPDQVSNAINCPDSLKPVTYFDKENSNWIFSYRMFANNRYVYGECDDKVNEYISAYIFTYSHDFQTLNEIKFFTPKSNASVDIKEMVKKICIVQEVKLK